jgi:Glycosyltransferase family 87
VRFKSFLTVFIAAIFTILALAFAPQIPAAVSDLPEYYASSYMLDHGNGAALYLPGEICALEHRLFPGMGERCMVMFSPPPGLIWLAPISLLPLKYAFALWTGVLVCLLSAAVIMIARFCRLTERQTLWFAAAICLSGPLFEAFKTGQLGIVLLFGFTGMLIMLEQKRYVPAALFASLLLLKPHYFLPFFACLLGARQYRAILHLFVMLLVASLIAWWLIGQSGFEQFAWLIKTGSTQTELMNPESTVTLRGQLLRLGLLNLSWWQPAAATLIAEIVYGIMIACAFFIGNKLRDNPDWLLIATAVIMPAAMTFSPHTFAYDLTIIYPAIVAWLQLRPLENMKGPVRLTISTTGLLALMAFSTPIYIFLHYGILLHAALINPLFIAMLIITAISLLALRKTAMSCVAEIS